MEGLPQEFSALDGVARGGAPNLCQDLPVFTLGEAANDTRIAKLARAIEQEIIPRLMLAHRVAPGSAPQGSPAQARRLGEADVKLFVKLVLAPDDEACSEGVRGFRAEGVSIESIYVDLLAPSARYLGLLWEDDLCTFTDVTIGLGRLQRILREQSPAFAGPESDMIDGRSVLLVPSPGEQHTLGLVMVGEFFRRAGWNVSGGAWTTGVDAASLVKAEWFDAIGLSLGAEIHLQHLTDIITLVRQVSCNRKIVVLVGGPLFGANPGFWEQVGADGMTIDGREAPLLADRLIARSVGRGAAQRA